MLPKYACPGGLRIKRVKGERDWPNATVRIGGKEHAKGKGRRSVGNGRGEGEKKEYRSWKVVQHTTPERGGVTQSWVTGSGICQTFVEKRWGKGGSGGKKKLANARMRES